MKQFLVFFCFFLSVGLSAQNYSAMTYNIRLDVESDGENAWPERRKELVKQVLFFEPDILGIQEGLPKQVKFLKRKLNAYNFIGHGRNENGKDEFSAIFYNAEKLEVITEDTFWLSNTPEVFSKGWDAALPRICTYGKFKDKIAGTTFWVFNTHFDHLGTGARLKSAQLILQKIKYLTDKKDVVVLMGDLNAEPDSEPIQIMSKSMHDSFKKAKITFGPEPTFNGFKYNEAAENRIDYIFLSKSNKITLKKYAVLNNSLDRRFISDHFPVYINFEIK